LVLETYDQDKQVGSDLTMIYNLILWQTVLGAVQLFTPTYDHHNSEYFNRSHII